MGDHITDVIMTHYARKPICDSPLRTGSYFLYFHLVFFHRHWRFMGQQGKRAAILISPFTSTLSGIFRHLFATFHLRWLPGIFNRSVDDIYPSFRIWLNVNWKYLEEAIPWTEDVNWMYIGRLEDVLDTFVTSYVC